MASPMQKRKLDDYAAKGRPPSFTRVGRTSVYEQDEIEETRPQAPGRESQERELVSSDSGKHRSDRARFHFAVSRVTQKSKPAPCW